MMKKALKFLEKSAKPCYKNITWLKLGLLAGEAKGPGFFCYVLRKVYMKKILLAVLFTLGAVSAHAAVTLTAVPIEGGDSLRFGRVGGNDEINRQVRLRITSTPGMRYEVRQRLADPVSDSRGNRLDPNVLMFYTLRGSNTRGSLYQDSLLSLDTNDQVLYSSDPAGDSDTLILSYNAYGKNIRSSGSFLGRIIFTVVPQGAAAPQEILMNVYIDTESSFSVSLVPLTGSSDLRFTSETTGEIALNIQGGLGKQYVVNQSMQEPLRNSSGDTLEDGAIKFSLYATNGTSEVAAGASLTHKPVKVYTSSSDGKADKLSLKFSFDPAVLAQLDAGTYRGMLVYDVESQGAIITSIQVPVQVEIKSVFSLEIVSEEGGTLMFRNVTPHANVPDKKVLVIVKTNMKKPYCVVQKIDTALTSTKGNTIETEKFRMRQFIQSNYTGTIVSADYAPVKVGDTIIFNSDNKGSPSEFEVDYNLLPASYKAGDYYLNCSYALMEK